MTGFVPDYLDAILQGVCKQTLNNLLKLLYGSDVREIDDKLKRMKVPHQISRLSRSLLDRSHWKAREFENFLLYCSIPIFFQNYPRNI